VIVVVVGPRPVSAAGARLVDAPAVEEDAVAVDARDPDLLQVEDRELDQVAVVVEDLQAVRRLTEGESDPLVRREPAQVAAERLLLAGPRDEEEVVVRPLVRRVVLSGRRADCDQADDPVVGPGALRQLGGEGPVGVGVDRLTLASGAGSETVYGRPDPRAAQVQVPRRRHRKTT
jgi:hypothetical protein